MKIAVIIPAYNEAPTIARVVRVACLNTEIAEVMVVCDGCTDDTAILANLAGAKTIVLEENRGKGAAMLVGAAATDADILVFVDADLIGLQPEHLTDLFSPLLNAEADMTVGVFAHGRLATDMAQLIAPYLSGQRAIRKQFLQLINNMEVSRYGIEMTMTKIAHKHGWKIKEVELQDLTHIMKEEKLGLVKGLGARMKMYWEIAKCLTQW